jgi:hypothetical protein
MFDTQVRDDAEARRATGLALARTEPSHIHIPRPSRVRQSTVTHADDEAQLTAELALEEAA